MGEVQDMREPEAEELRYATVQKDCNEHTWERFGPAVLLRAGPWFQGGEPGWAFRRARCGVERSGRTAVRWLLAAPAAPGWLSTQVGRRRSAPRLAGTARVVCWRPCGRAAKVPRSADAGGGAVVPHSREILGILALGTRSAVWDPSGCGVRANTCSSGPCGPNRAI